jgi:hypothetical protein
MITFDKIIPRIISKQPRDISIPIEKILSNAININIPNTSKTIMNPNDTSRHDYLNPENKAQARKLRGIYNA